MRYTQNRLIAYVKRRLSGKDMSLMEFLDHNPTNEPVYVEKHAPMA